mmetsp:Transcript_29822/g.28516  ORF Transcript_29822/g.28516 Transcript_29822/m.28516 type:complete len:97 (-) Transcript_29822:1063-1353(-)
MMGVGDTRGATLGVTISFSLESMWSETDEDIDGGEKGALNLTGDAVTGDAAFALMMANKASLVSTDFSFSVGDSFGLAGYNAGEGVAWTGIGIALD